MDFSGKVAVVTGGASGIGLAVCRALAKRGAQIVIADIEQGALDSAVQQLSLEGLAAVGRKVDVGSRHEIEALAQWCWSAFGAVHIVMHNAGVVAAGPAQSLTYQDWEWALRVNLHGPIYGTQAFLPRMLEEQQRAHMVFTSSFAGLVPNRHFAPYNVTKAAVVALAESLHKDLRDTNIGVSVLCPMRVASRIEESFRNRSPELGGGTIERVYTDSERVSLQGRVLPAEPVAELVVDAIIRRDLYVHTHSEARNLVLRRTIRILSAFDRAL